MSSDEAPSVNWPILIGGLIAIAALVAVLASGFGTDPKIVSNGQH